MGDKTMLLEWFIFGMITFLMSGAQCQVTVFAEVGSQAVLPCKCRYGSASSSIVVWSKSDKGTVWRKERSGLQYWGAKWQGGDQRAQCPHSKFEQGDYSLQINNVGEEDGGVYTCMEEHRGIITENKVTLRIIRVSISPSAPILGNDVTITCHVTPPLYGATVRWMLNNRPFVTKQITDSVRVKANMSLAGDWTCETGYMSQKKQASATLEVQGIIRPSKDDAKVYAAVGSAVTLPCVFSTDLNPYNFVWEKLKPGSLFTPARDRLPASFSPSSPTSQPPWDKSASLTEVGTEDKGKYRCSGTVEGQHMTRNMQLVVAKIDSSIPPKNKGSVTLTCQLSDTSEVTDYEWVHVTYDVNDTESVEFIAKGQTLAISKVSEKTWGEWTCRFYGREGILGNVTHHIQLMSGLSGQKSSNLSHNTAAVVGLSFLLVVLLLILAQMYKNHQRRKRIFQYPALETIVHTISNEREERARNQPKM